MTLCSHDTSNGHKILLIAFFLVPSHPQIHVLFFLPSNKAQQSACPSVTPPSITNSFWNLLKPEKKAALLWHIRLKQVGVGQRTATGLEKMIFSAWQQLASQSARAARWPVSANVAPNESQHMADLGGRWKGARLGSEKHKAAGKQSTAVYRGLETRKE